MKRIFWSLVGVCVLFFFFVAPRAEAIKIGKAEIKQGAVQVEGEQAAKSATITWEGVAVATSNRGGKFTFSTTNLPSDCVGTLSDGVSTIDVVIKDCQPAPPAVSEILATGQTQCWDSSGTPEDCAGTGQDGELQKGATRSYTDNGDGTITDNATGLMWEKLTNDGSIHDYNNLYTWGSAFVKIAALNTPSCFATYCDWRLPNINELQTLADYGRFVLAIDPAFNNGTDSFTKPPCWSSTTAVGNPAFAWSVVFLDGMMFVQIKTYNFSVRAVRGGP